MTIVAPAGAEKTLKDAGFANIVVMKPGDTTALLGVTVEAVPAYNTNKSYHSKGNGWVGYIVTLGGVRFYHAGDTDVIPEMQTVRADVVFLPVGGTYTMTAEEAVIAANTIKPVAAVPMHYGDVVGNSKDAEKFIGKLSSPIQGIILK